MSFLYPSKNCIAAFFQFQRLSTPGSVISPLLLPIFLAKNLICLAGKCVSLSILLDFWEEEGEERDHKLGCRGKLEPQLDSQKSHS